MRATRRGLIVVISAPSGAGKSTVIKGLLAADANLWLSVSMTTRPPRRGERDGVDYRFVDDATFDSVVAANGFAEWAHVHDHRYGTPIDRLDVETRAGRDVVLDIDVQGAAAIRERYPDAVSIFLDPPSFEELERRLRSRATDTEAAIAHRLANARRELAEKDKYAYAVVNDVVDGAVAAIRGILARERDRGPRT